MDESKNETPDARVANTLTKWATMPEECRVVRTYWVRDGWRAERFEDGSVRIYSASTLERESPQLYLHLGVDEWASFVASMLGEGDSGENYRTVRNLHLQTK